MRLVLLYLLILPVLVAADVFDYNATGFHYKMEFDAPPNTSYYFEYDPNNHYSVSGTKLYFSSTPSSTATDYYTIYDANFMLKFMDEWDIEGVVNTGTDPSGAQSNFDWSMTQTIGGAYTLSGDFISGRFFNSGGSPVPITGRNTIGSLNSIDGGTSSPLVSSTRFSLGAHTYTFKKRNNDDGTFYIETYVDGVLSANHTTGQNLANFDTGDYYLVFSNTAGTVGRASVQYDSIEVTAYRYIPESPETGYQESYSADDLAPAVVDGIVKFLIALGLLASPFVFVWVAKRIQRGIR